STKTKDMKARVLAATNQNRLEKVKRGGVREDLYYRLRVVALNLPPLRERREDIPLLLRHFIEHVCNELDKEVMDVSEEVLRLFMAYQWPGNIRELKNTLEHICILCKGPIITIEDLPADFLRDTKAEAFQGKRDAITPQAVLSALEEAEWNRTRAARLLGISRRTLYRKLEEYDLMEEIESHKPL
ncbi:MAG: sigma-54-dependent Fis family transcriptional regulator, partial [Deltaproteobacteria bacterium]|nr:sigma-54-dependent Fis family transcriptional regulator [Deltaproteobacteria bacterium]